MNNKNKALYVSMLLTAWLAFPLAQANSSGYRIQVIARIGDTAPGGQNYQSYFGIQDMNQPGDIMFVSDIADASGNYAGEALYLYRHGIIQKITSSGEPAPGTQVNFGPWGMLWPSGMNDRGDMAFAFVLDNFDDANQQFGLNTGVWRYHQPSKTIAKVFAPGDTAPGITTFRGAYWRTDINNNGDIAAVGMIDTPYGNCQDASALCFGLGNAVYHADKRNRIRKIVAPGDATPDGFGQFDDAWDVNINERGDITFGAHVAGEECIGGNSSTLGCFTSLYLYRANTGKITSVAHQGDPAPGGGHFREVFEGQINSRGDIAYIGNLATVQGEEALGVFVSNRSGKSYVVARPGDSLPGGVMLQAAFSQGNHGINNDGDIAFSAKLDADANGDGVNDTGVYIKEHGKIATVIRTGSVIPGLGKVAHVNFRFFGDYPVPGVFLNDRGQVTTQVIMENGDNYVVLATPNNKY